MQKQRWPGIKWTLFLSFILFSAIMIGLLWLFQIVLLDSFYRQIKTRSLIRSTDVVVSNIDNENLSTLVSWIRRDDEISIRVLDMSGRAIVSSDALFGDILHRIPASELADLRAKAIASGGSYSEIVTRKSEIEEPRSKDSFIGRLPPGEEVLQETILAVRTSTLADGTAVIVLASTLLTPVNSTVNTLRSQLAIITVIMLVLSLLLAVAISRRIARPIVRINDRSKELARGHFSVRFKPEGYKEIAELAETLNQAAVDLNQVENLRRELIANVSHDLRTPLTMISGFAEVMRDLPGENSQENAQVIIDESRRLTGLVNDLLDLSRMQSETQPLDIRPYSLTTSIRSIIGRYSKLVEQEHYELIMEASQDITVRADEHRIEQVLYNLINNAIVYAGQDKRIIIRQSVLDRNVKVEVIDNGAGIAKDQLPFIWERYYKGEKSRQRDVVGTGLGLSIVKNILDRHNAEYGVSSRPGAGSVFWFTLPIA